MAVLGTLPNDKRKLIGKYVNENSKYQTGMGRLAVLKQIAQNIDESPERRAQARAEYDKLKPEIDASGDRVEQLQDKIDSLEGGKEVTKITEKYKKLLEKKELLIDPNDPAAASIDAEIEKLVKPFQNAYSKVVGTRVSETVAKSNLFGTKIATFNTDAKGATKPTGIESVGTSIPSSKPASVKKPAAKAPAAKEEVVAEATTRNPVTGEVINVADIQPNTGQKPVPTVGGPVAMPPVDREAAAEKIVTGADFGLSEALFKNVPSLKVIFDQYTDPKSGMTDDEFRKLIRQDVWYKKNSKEIKNRFVQLYNYQDLKNSGQDVKNTDYAKQIRLIEDKLRKNAVIMGSDIASNPSELTKIAENLYITDRSEDDSFITDLLAARIHPVGGTLGGRPTTNYSGQALKDYNALLQTARNNGFKISDILPGGSNVDQLLQNIAAGKIDINRVAQDARTLASQGQPQYVRDLLAQGYDLAQVFAPYRQTMANVLEIGDPNQIDLNDPLLRTAITDKGDMNLYDFKKALRQDNRWQYTEQAKQDVSNAALGVLRDFGFQG